MIGKTNAGSGTQVFYLGTGTSFDVSNVPGYQNLTVDDFIVCASYASASAVEYHSASCGASPSKSYNSSTGMLTIIGLNGNGSSEPGHSSTTSVSISISAPKVYLVKGKIKQL